MKLRRYVTIIVACAVFFTAGCKESAQTEYVHVGPNWAAIHNIEPGEKNFKVELKGQETLKAGEAIQFEIKSAKTGKLWFVQVDPNDKVSLLFPNKMSKDNNISANTWFKVPPADAPYRIYAENPNGQSTLAAVVTTGDTGLNDILASEKSMAKALVLIESQPAWGIGHKVVDVKEK
jgi:hypothetical protein